MPPDVGHTEEAGASWTDATRGWVEEQLGVSEFIQDVRRLRGGWTSEIRRVDVHGPEGERSLVLRSFVRSFFVEHAEGLLNREAAVLQLLEGTGIPVARLLAVDATARRCTYPSLLMTLMPGSVRLDDADIESRALMLARELIRIHGVAVSTQARPRTYQAWTTADLVKVPAGSARPQLWRRAVDIIRQDPPEHVPCFLHRDFHPGNVLFEGCGEELRIAGVVDWVETSWGPADLDVAHCATNLALLHGVPEGMAFAQRYVDAGGSLAPDTRAHLYWRLLDALAFAPTAEKVADPWRELGRTDLSDLLVANRLEDYIHALIEEYD